MDNELQFLDDNYNMKEKLLWLFPDMLPEGANIKLKIKKYELIEEDNEGKKYDKPILSLHVKTDTPIKVKETPYDEFQISFWTLCAKNREYKPSEVLKAKHKWVITKHSPTKMRISPDIDEPET